ncbi:MAG: RNA ligase [Myxococcales bacterium]|nr:RNA ligase [Myxococcales bacterium]
MSDTHSPFESYHKIAESAGGWRLSEADTRALNKVPWVVTEKIHGANFSFLTDGRELRCAKRKALLGSDESFFQHEAVLARHQGAVSLLFERLQAEREEIEVIQLYGELFGGGYPHPDVPPVPDVYPIQTGVWYAPGVRFCAFDVALTLQSGERVFLAYDEMTALLEELEIPCAEPLMIGSLGDCLEFPVRFSSTIPALLGLPPLPDDDNLAEGVVLKPVPFVEVETEGGPLRPILKLKIAEFSEDDRYHQARPWPKRDEQGAGYALDLLEWEMMARVNVNRLDNAISKIGRVEGADDPRRAELLSLFVEDVWEDLAVAHADELGCVRAEERELLRAVLLDEAQALLQSRLG